MPTPALQPGKICIEAMTLYCYPYIHTLNGSWPTGCQAGQKEGDSFYDSPILGRGPDLLPHLGTLGWEREPPSLVLAECVFRPCLCSCQNRS